jgi:hypothetical protein
MMDTATKRSFVIKTTFYLKQRENTQILETVLTYLRDH